MSSRQGKLSAIKAFRLWQWRLWDNVQAVPAQEHAAVYFLWSENVYCLDRGKEQAQASIRINVPMMCSGLLIKLCLSTGSDASFGGTQSPCVTKCPSVQALSAVLTEHNIRPYILKLVETRQAALSTNYASRYNGYTFKWVYLLHQCRPENRLLL